MLKPQQTNNTKSNESFIEFRKSNSTLYCLFDHPTFDILHSINLLWQMNIMLHVAKAGGQTNKILSNVEPKCIVHT